jgi:hypothetical protein
VVSQCCKKSVPLVALFGCGLDRLSAAGRSPESAGWNPASWGWALGSLVSASRSSARWRPEHSRSRTRENPNSTRCRNNLTATNAAVGTGTGDRTSSSPGRTWKTQTRGSASTGFSS